LSAQHDRSEAQNRLRSIHSRKQREVSWSLTKNTIVVSRSFIGGTPPLAECLPLWIGRSSDSQASSTLAFSPPSGLPRSGGCQRQWRKERAPSAAWSQRRGRPGLTPEFPVRRPIQQERPTTNTPEHAEYRGDARGCQTDQLAGKLVAGSSGTGLAADRDDGSCR